MGNDEQPRSMAWLFAALWGKQGSDGCPVRIPPTTLFELHSGKVARALFTPLKCSIAMYHGRVEESLLDEAGVRELMQWPPRDEDGGGLERMESRLDMGIGSLDEEEDARADGQPTKKQVYEMEAARRDHIVPLDVVMLQGVVPAKHDAGTLFRVVLSINNQNLPTMKVDKLVRMGDAAGDAGDADQPLRLTSSSKAVNEQLTSIANTVIKFVEAVERVRFRAGVFDFVIDAKDRPWFIGCSDVMVVPLAPAVPRRKRATTPAAAAAGGDVSFDLNGRHADALFIEERERAAKLVRETGENMGHRKCKGDYCDLDMAKTEFAPNGAISRRVDLRELPECDTFFEILNKRILQARQAQQRFDERDPAAIAAPGTFQFKQLQKDQLMASQSSLLAAEDASPETPAARLAAMQLSSGGSQRGSTGTLPDMELLAREHGQTQRARKGAHPSPPTTHPPPNVSVEKVMPHVAYREARVCENCYAVYGKMEAMRAEQARLVEKEMRMSGSPAPSATPGAARRSKLAERLSQTPTRRLEYDADAHESPSGGKPPSGKKAKGKAKDVRVTPVQRRALDVQRRKEQALEEERRKARPRSAAERRKKAIEQVEGQLREMAADDPARPELENMLADLITGRDSKPRPRTADMRRVQKPANPVSPFQLAKEGISARASLRPLRHEADNGGAKGKGKAGKSPAAPGKTAWRATPAPAGGKPAPATVVAGGKATPSKFRRRVVQSPHPVALVSKGTTVPFELLLSADVEAGGEPAYDVVVFHDVFDTIEATRAVFDDVAAQTSRTQILLYNYPGQAYSHAPDVVLDNEMQARAAGHLVLGKDDDGSFSRPTLIVGIGFGAQVAATFASLFEKRLTLSGVVLVNGTSWIDRRLAMVVANMAAASKVMQQAVVVPVASPPRTGKAGDFVDDGTQRVFRRAFRHLFHSPSFGARSKTAAGGGGNVDMLFSKAPSGPVRNPLPSDQRIALCHGVQHYGDMRSVLSAIPVPIFDLRSTADALGSSSEAQRACLRERDAPSLSAADAFSAGGRAVVFADLVADDGSSIGHDAVAEAPALLVKHLVDIIGAAHAGAGVKRDYLDTVVEDEDGDGYEYEEVEEEVEEVEEVEEDEEEEQNASADSLENVLTASEGEEDDVHGRQEPAGQAADRPRSADGAPHDDDDDDGIPGGMAAAEAEIFDDDDDDDDVAADGRQEKEA